MGLGEWVTVAIMVFGLLGVLVWVVKVHARALDALIEAGSDEL